LSSPPPGNTSSGRKQVALVWQPAKNHSGLVGALGVTAATQSCTDPAWSQGRLSVVGVCSG